MTADADTPPVRRRSDGAPPRRSVISDVAERAGVSPMTVSRVINATAPVRPATRERVLAAMRELDYQPSTAARALKTGRSELIGVVAHQSTLFGPISTLDAIEQTARSAGYTALVITVEHLDTDSAREAVNALRRQTVDGLIVMAPYHSALVGLAELDVDLPLVTVQSHTDNGISAATIDQRAGARRATELLLSLGHDTVWHLAGPEDWVEAAARSTAWSEVLRANGITPPPLLEGDWTARSGYELTRDLLAGNDGVTALFAANDQMALGAYRAAHEAGVSIPADLSIVGFDDIPEAAYLAPPLTTVRQDFAQVGRCAIELLLEKVADPTGPGRHRLVDADVVLRDSTAAAPTPGGRRSRT